MDKKQPARWKNPKTLFGGALLLLALFVAAIAWSNRPRSVEVSTEAAFRKEVVHIVTATGTVQPEIEVVISPDVSGEIIELPVEEGQHVDKGALLFKIEPDLYINQVEQGRAQLNLARSQSHEARSRKLKAEDDFRKADLLYAEKLISQSDYLAAKTNAEAAKAAWEASRFSILQYESLLQQNQERLEKTVVRAPISGAIISLDSKAGERVVGTGQFPGTDVLRLADLDSMEVDVEVNENDIVNVRLGNPVQVSVDAYGERRFEGVVREISNSAVTTAAGTQEEAINFAVKIRILNHQRLLKPGMSATADIECQRVPDALVVPIQSVTIRSTARSREGEASGNSPAGSREGLEGVFVFESGTARFRPVETGTTDNTHIIVTSGLKEGEEVVSGSYTAISSQLQDGTRVRRGR